jgi:hypothetical protein
MRHITIKRARTWHYRKMRLCTVQFNDLAPLSLFRFWLGCITNTSGYDFRKGQVASDTSRLSCGKPSEARVFTPIRESSGESRLHKPARETLFDALDQSGPWGSGGKGPWGSGPQSTGPTPPDLEEILRRGQDRLRRVLPGGNLGGRGLALIVLGVLALWGFSGFFRVEPDELGVVLRFGKAVRSNRA